MRGCTRCLSDDASFSERHILICDAQNCGSAPSPAALRADDLSRTRGEVKKQSRSRGASCCARGLSNSEAKTSQDERGGGAPKGAPRDHSALSQRCRWAGSRRAPLLADALAFRRSTSRLSPSF